MKKFISLLFLTLSLILFANLPVTNFGYATQTSNAPTQTIFVVQSQYIANTNDGVFLYDKSDQCLKLLNAVSAQSKSFDVGKCVDLCCIDNEIYILTDTNVKVFNTKTFETTTINVEQLQDYDYYKKITVSKINNEPVICIYPLDTANGQNVIYGINTGLNYEFYTIEFSQNQFNQTTNISLLDFITCNNSIYLLKAYEQSITSFPITSLGDNLLLSTATTLVLSDTNLENEIIAIKNLYANETSNVVISFENKTDVYEFDGSTLTFKNSVSHRYQEELFNCISMSVNNNQIALLGDNCYFLVTYDTNLTITSKMANPICDIMLRDCKNFKYYSLAKESNIITALGSNQTNVLPEGSFVAEIADVTLSDGTMLKGYKYVMYTMFELVDSEYIGINLFGYVDTTNDCLIELNQNYTTSTVKVFENSKLYSLPSIVVKPKNEQNTIVKNISANVPVKVLCYISDYKNEYNQTTTQYALVEVGGDVGFIDTKAIISTDKRVILVITNAKLVSEANIYEYASTSSSILHKLDESTRVKILEGRDSNGFLKIAYNDADGNYFEGYVKAYNVSADHYTTLQIIGTVLVLLNLVFLIVLLITKRKIVR